MAELKPTWKRVKFGDVVRQVKDKVPAKASGLKRYVAGAHMDTDNLHLGRWGEISDDYLGPAFHMRFQPGHVLYGSRRTYLRKVAVAEFEGICANTTFVLESRDPGVLLPALLPFLMTTEAFHEHSTSQSKGSVNPYVNFSDLAWYEFALPPIEEQQRIARTLGQLEEVRQATRDARVVAAKLFKSFLVHTFRPERGRRDTIPDRWRWANVDECGDVQLGQQRHPKFKTGANIRPYLRVANVLDGWIDFSDVLEMNFPERDLAKFELMDGDILLNEGQSTELVGRSAIYRGEVAGCCVQKTLIRFRCGPLLRPGFAQAFFQHSLYTGQFSRMVVQTTSMAHLTAVRFKSMKMPIAPLHEQDVVADVVASLRGAQNDLEQHRSRLDRLVKAFVRKHLEVGL